MNVWTSGGIGAVSAVAGAVLGFLVCRLRWPRRGELIDSGAIIALLFGVPIGYAVGLTAGLLAVRPAHVLPALGIGLLPFALLVASIFAFRKRIR
jgi:hypothetical protein